MFCSAGADDTRELLAVLIPLVPAVLYSMGLMEGKKGRYLVFAGLLVHLFFMTIRGVTLGAVPLTEKHDTISFMAFSAALSFAYLSLKHDLKGPSLIALPLISTILVVAVFHKPINTIAPLLRTPWFYIHSFLFFGSYGLLGISFCTGLYFLVSRDRKFESLQYLTALAGWVMYTVALVVGSIWFYVAYGTYWIWTSRELWTTLAWFYFGLYLHARMMQGLMGRPASGIGVAGYAVLLFSYFGVGTVIPSPPTEF